jgi:predicted transcriptional regulator
MASAKDSARALIEQLPDEASWDEIMYEFYVKQKIDAGLEAAADGRTVPHEDIKARLMQRKRVAS